MALSIPSVASSSEPSVNYTWEYDVFLSFRGDDTRKGVVSHLYDELQNRSGIKTFKDDIRLEVGAPISPSLLKAIEESRFAVVVLSANYGSSTWCLDELTHIFRCMKGKDRILPLFYYVDPSHVRNQRGSFQAAFDVHEKKYKNDLDNVKKWRVALTRVGNLSGWNADKFPSERELVMRIAEDMSKKVAQIPPLIVLDEPDEFSEEVEGRDISFGPYGSGKEGLHSFDDGVHLAVRQLVIHHVPPYPRSRRLPLVKWVVCIQIEYVSDDGNSLWCEKHGDPTARVPVKKNKVVLDYPEEYLTSIHGRYDKSLGSTFIISLTFKSNKRIYGPFGGVLSENGNHFSIEQPGYQIVGFHGKTDERWWCLGPGLRAIGAHLKPL